MKFTVKCLVTAGIVGVAAVVTPIALTIALPAVSTGTASLASAASSSSCSASLTNDEICYVQTTGSTGAFTQYVPASINGTGTATSVALTSGGGCATPTWQSAPLLIFTPRIYDNAYSTLNTQASAAAAVDASKQKTGVCGINGTGTNPWAIDNVGGTGAEALDFSVGTNSNLGSPGRLFSNATIDVANASSASTSVTLVETLGGKANVVGTQTCPIAGGASLVQTNTQGTGPCINASALSGPFDTIEVRVAVGGSVTVVGPSSVFYLASQVCGGSTIYSTNGNGAASVSLTLDEPSSTCKSYTSFTSNIDPGSGQDQVVFGAYGSSDLHFSAQVTWPVQSFCTPDGSNSTAICAPTDVTYSDPVTGVSYNGPQVYCNAASTSGPGDQLCTTNKVYDYQVSYNGAPGTQITEKWDGLLDWGLRH